MNYGKIAKILVISSFIPLLYNFFFPGKIAIISMFCSYPVIILIINRHLKDNLNILEKNTKLILKVFIGFNLIILLRGFIDLSSIQDKQVFFSASLPTFVLLPISIFAFIYNIENIKIAFKTFLFIVLPFAFIMYGGEFLGMYDFSHAVSPVYLLIIFSPYLTRKWKIMVFILAFLSFFSDLTVRTNLLNIVVAYLIVFSFKFRRFQFLQTTFQFLRRLLLYSPILFLFLGFTGVFNIFKIGDYFEKYEIETNKSGDKQDLLVDSRTAIYVDVFSELNDRKAFLFGLGVNGKTKTSLTDVSYADYDIIYKEGRRGTESGMLNYIQWGGLFGLISYYLLFIHASYLALYKSNNWLSKALGVWLAYKCLFSFIEDRLFFGIYAIFIFITIAMCLNNNFRKLNNTEMMLFAKNIFNKKIKLR